MDAIRFSSAADLATQELADAFNAAFEGYFVPMRHTGESLTSMVRTNDIHLADSLIARPEAGALVGVGLLGIRGTRGWIGGMAITPEHRGHGAGAALMAALIARARDLGLSTLQLEVLDQNTAARRLYTRLGFVETRPLVVYTGAGDVDGVRQLTPPISEIAVAEALARFDQLHAVAAPWQREEASLLRMAPSLFGLCLRDEQGIRSYILWMPSGSGYGILDFGSRRTEAAERESDALALITHLLSSDSSATLRAINVPPGDALGGALAALGCAVVATQREMRLSLG